MGLAVGAVAIFPCAAGLCSFDSIIPTNRNTAIGCYFFLFFLVPWGHTLGSKINRVAGRVLKIPLASVIIDKLIKCSQSFNTIRVK